MAIAFALFQVLTDQSQDIRSMVLIYLKLSPLNLIKLYNTHMQNQAADNNKQAVEDAFSAIFEDPFNTVCFECGRKTKQWVQTELAIFLCLTCAGLYKAASDELQIKCINLDPFTKQELNFIKKGGNSKLKSFLCNYEMQEYIYREKLQTKAVAYYRIMLNEEFHGRVAPMAPNIEEGRQFANPVKKLTEMTPGEVFEELTSKAKKAGQSAIELGGKAFTSIHDKLTSNQFKQGAIYVGESISTTAKSWWHKITETMDTLMQQKRQQPTTEQKTEESHEKFAEKKE